MTASRPRIRFICSLLVLCSGLSYTTAFAESSSSAPDSEQLNKQISKGEHASVIDQLTKRISKEGAETEPDVVRALLRALRITGKYGEGVRRARNYLDQISVQDASAPAVEGVRADLAQLLFLSGKNERALQIANQIIEDQPDRMKARWIRVRLHRRTGQYDRMETDFDYAAKYVRERSDPIEDVETVLNLSRIRWMDGRWNGKTRVVQSVNRRLQRANERFEQHPELRTLWADLFRTKHRDQDARRTYREVLSFNKSYPPALVGMATIMLRNRTSLRVGEQQAYSLLDRALSTNPNYLPALVTKARQQMIENKKEEVKETIQTALGAHENAPQAWALSAVYHYRQDQNEQYRKARRNAFAINENYGMLDAMLARTLSDDFKYVTARTFFRKAAKRNPNLWTVQRDRGINELRLGNEKRGKKIIQRSFQNNRFDVLAYNMLELLDKLENKFETSSIPGYRVRIHQKEAGYAQPYVHRLLKRLRREFMERYDYQLDEPTLVEVFEDHRDFSVRTAGMQGLGALGACFGSVSISLSPRAKDQMGAFNWGAILWHEMAHAYALQMSDMNVPRWFTEGLSTYEEGRGYASWEREKAHRLFRAWKADKLPTIPELASGKGGGLLTYYLYGSVIIEYLVERHGFDAITDLLRAYGEGNSTKTAFKNVLDAAPSEVQDKFSTYLSEKFGSMPFRSPVTRIQTGRKEGGNGTEGGGKMPVPVPDLSGEDASSASYDKMINRARFMVARGQAKRALKKAEQAKETDPDRPMAYAVMGDVRYEQQDWVLAEKRYGEAYERGAGDMKTLLQYGKTLEKRDRIDRAISMYEEAREAFPGYVDEDLNPYLQLFPLYIEKGQPQKAIEALEGYTDRAHKDFSHHMKLASLYHDTGRWEKARDLLERMVYINYRDLELHQYLVDAYEALEQWEKAHTERYVIVALLRDLDQENEKWKQLIASNLYHAARMSAKLGELERARQELSNARDLGLSLKKARDLLQKLN
jgi:tetratricopeptide (TPR) repeat protein